jgi:hypothetical protein
MGAILRRAYDPLVKLNAGSIRTRLVAMTLALAACTPIATSTAPSDPPARAPARSDPAPRPTPPSSSTPASTPSLAPSEGPRGASAWTDAVITDRLTKDCAWEPPVTSSADEPSPLACSLELEQSCLPDPCFDDDQQTCKPACKKACGDCAATCTKDCQSCKHLCADEGCRHACAATCGSCRQACLSVKDRCASGTCGQAYSACRKKLTEDWKRSTCKVVCPRVSQCAIACRTDDNVEKCTAGCRKRLMAGCPERFLGMCLVGADPTID